MEETMRARLCGLYNTLHSRPVGPYFDRYAADETGKKRFLHGAALSGRENSQPSP